MKFYSEVLKELFDTAEACGEAEAAHAKAEAEKEGGARHAQKGDDLGPELIHVLFHRPSPSIL